MSSTLFDPLGSSLRTHLLSALAARTGCSATWSEAATPARRSWWVLTTLAHRTGGNGCGSLAWQTPTAGCATGGNGTRSGARSGELLLTGQARHEAANWPTPRSADAEQAGGHRGTPDTLTAATRTWNTPSAQDAKNLTLPPSQTQRDPVVGQLLRESPSTIGKPHGSLSSKWVLQLQGYPDGWLDLPTNTLSTLSETRKSRRSSKS